MKKSLILGLVLAIVISAGTVIATPNFQATTVSNPVTGEAKNTIAIPSTAIKVAPSMYYLGSAKHNGKTVEGYAIIHYKKAPVKPGTVCGNGICEPGENARKCPADCSNGIPDDSNDCYTFLAREAKWKTVENYIVNPTNTEGLNTTTILSNFASDIQKWETVAGVNIIGTGSSTTDTLVADMDNPDGKNEAYFGDISDNNAIGVTIIWGIFGGPPKNRELVEWDQIYNQVDFDWSLTGETGKMDFENIATHELGHSVGMGDLYTSDCSEQTMYGYASNGETKKRTLESGDKTGIKKLYS